MIADIIKQRETILASIAKAGIPQPNLYSVLLYGSHYWGYDRPDSDIDLYIVVKKGQERLKDIENISLHYQITPQQVNEKVRNGSWATYFCCKYASYLLYGKRVEVPDYPKEKILDFLKKHKEDEIDMLLKASRHWCFQALMKRLFFVNYFFNNVKTFKLTDFQLCKQLSQEEIKFLEEQYVKIFQQAPEDIQDNKELKALTLKVEDMIKTKIR